MGVVGSGAGRELGAKEAVKGWGEGKGADEGEAKEEDEGEERRPPRDGRTARGPKRAAATSHAVWLCCGPALQPLLPTALQHVPAMTSESVQAAGHTLGTAVDIN